MDPETINAVIGGLVGGTIALGGLMMVFLVTWNKRRF
jgi:hypothetical protein